MHGNNASIAGLEQSRLPGSMGTGIGGNPWPASTPAPQQPLPHLAPNVMSSSMNNPHFNLPQIPATISRSSTGPIANATPNIPMNLKQENPAAHPSPTLNGPISTKPPSSSSPANVVITTSDKIPTEEEVKAAAATSNTPIINSVTVPPQHRLGWPPTHSVYKSGSRMHHSNARTTVPRAVLM